MANTDIAVRQDQLQMIPIQEAKEWYDMFVEFSKSILKKDLDYGIIPGTPKPTLLKAGAEKLRFAYGLSSEFENIDKVVDLDRPFVDYTYRCTIKSKQGQILAQCEGNCNSMEAKFGFLWVTIEELPEGIDTSKLKVRTSGKKMQEFAFAVEKAETGGQYGKPAEYWQKWKDAIAAGTARLFQKETRNGKKMDAYEIDEQVTQYRITNPDVVGMKNTIMKMAQKRAFVGAVLIATGASEFYTQDLEDMEIKGHIYTPEVDVQAPPAASANSHVEDIEHEEVPPRTNNHIEDEDIDMSIWSTALAQCRSKSELSGFYKSNQAAVDKSDKLKQLFKIRENQLTKSASKTQNS